MMIVKQIAGVVAVALFGVLGPVAASTTFTVPGDSQTYTFGAVGDDADYSDVSASVTVTLTSISGSTVTFAFDATNTSDTSDGLTAAQLSAIGFDVLAPNHDFTVASTSPFADVRRDAKFPGGGSTRLDVCLASSASGSNCTGTGNGNTGLGIGDSSTFNVVFAFADDVSFVTLDNLFVRYKAIDITGEVDDGSASAFGVTTVIPEPGTWALMLVGFSLAGLGLRQRRQIAEAA